MSTVWRVIATFALPTPLALLVLLNLPLPKPFKRGVLTFVSRVFDLPIVGVAKMLHVMLFSLLLTVVTSARHLQLLNANPTTAIPYGTPNFEIANLSKRWRAERNLWLSAFAFTMWAVLAAFYRELSRRVALEERLAEFEMSDYTATIDTTRDASISKEVTSQFNTLISPRKSPAVSPVKPTRRNVTAGGRGGGSGSGVDAAGKKAVGKESMSPADAEVELTAAAAANKKSGADALQKKDL